MRYKNLFASTILSLLCIIALPAAEQEDHDDDSPLHQAMETMGDSYKNLGRGLRNPDPAAKDDYLAWLQTIETNAIQAKQYVPPHVLTLPESEQPAMITSFRSDLAGAIVTMLQLEQAILADDWVNVRLLGQKLRSQRSEAHKKYNPEE